MKQAIHVKYKLSNYQKMLVIAMVITPFTALRPTLIGFGELFFIFAFIYEIIHSLRNIKFFLFSKFWFIYILLTLFGVTYNTLFLDLKNVDMKNIIFDFSSYLVVFMTCFLFEILIYYKKLNIYQFLKNVFLSFSIILSILYFISFFKPSLFGHNLIYANIYFVPLTNNLHQISMFLSPLIFVGVLQLRTEKNKILKIIIILFIIIDVIMDFHTGSDKAVLGVSAGIVILIFFSIFNYFNGKLKILILLFGLLFLLPTLIYNYNSINKTVVEYFHKNDLNDGRYLLYTKALDLIVASPIFGYGPGTRIPNIDDKLYDAHQTFLAVSLQTGILGIIIIFFIYFKIIIRLINSPILFAAFMPILIYSIGGDILRKLSIWIFLILFYYYNKADEKQYVINLQ